MKIRFSAIFLALAVTLPLSAQAQIMPASSKLPISVSKPAYSSMSRKPNGKLMAATGERSADGGLVAGSGPLVMGASPDSEPVSDRAAAPTSKKGNWQPGVRLEKRVAQPVVPGGNMPCDGRDLLYRGHVDATYATKENGKLTVKVVDGSDVRDHSEVCIRLPEDAVDMAMGGYQVGDEISRIVVPNDPSWRFLGNPGAIVWYAPQVDYHGAPVWAGTGAFDPVHEWQVPQDIDQDLVTLQLVKVETPTDQVLTPKNNNGPEQVNIFTTDGSRPGGKLISTNLGIWEYKSVVGGHNHANWTFSAPGYWRLHWKAKMSVNGKPEESKEIVQTWAVGSNKDLMLQGAQSPGTTRISRTAEDMRAAAKMEAPKDNGFDYHGDNTGGNSYDPGQDCKNLKAPVKPVPAARVPFDPAKVKQFMDNNWWSSYKEMPAKQYRFIAWHDPTSPTVQGRIFTDQANDSEVASVMAPKGVPSEENDWGLDKPTPNSIYPSESKVIPVPDSTLTAYAPGTFSQTQAFAEQVKNNQLYTLGWGNDKSAGFMIQIPKDPTGRMQTAEINLQMTESTEYPEMPQAAVGVYSLDQKTKVEKWEHLAASMDSDRRKFTMKPGENKLVQFQFATPGATEVGFTVTFRYKNPKESDPGPLQSSFRFLVGNETINAFHALPKTENPDSKSPTALPTGAAAQLSPGFYGVYNQSVALYNQKVAQCQAKPAPNPKPKPGGDKPGANSDQPSKENGGGSQSTSGQTPNSDSSSGNPAGLLQPSSGTLLSGLGGGGAIAPAVPANGAAALPPAQIEGTSTPPAASASPEPLQLNKPKDDSLELKNMANMAGVSNGWWSKLPWILVGMGITAAVVGIGMLVYALFVVAVRRKVAAIQQQNMPLLR